MSYCFGSALIEHYKETFPHAVEAGDDIIVTLLGEEKDFAENDH